MRSTFILTVTGKFPFLPPLTKELPEEEVSSVRKRTWHEIADSLRCVLHRPIHIRLSNQT